VLTRAVYAYAYATSQNDRFRGAVLQVEDRPVALEEALLAARLRDFVRYLGDDDEIVRAALRGRSPEAAAADLVRSSAFATQEGTAAALDGDLAASDDPALTIAALVWPRLGQYQQQAGVLGAQVQKPAAHRARARSAAAAPAIPRAATSPPRT